MLLLMKANLCVGFFLFMRLISFVKFYISAAKQIFLINLVKRSFEAFFYSLKPKSMKKIYSSFLFIVILLTSQVNTLNAQCNVAAPTVSGNTFVCGSSGIFTLTASGPSSITMWYTGSPNPSSVSANAVFTTPSLTNSTTFYAAQLAPGNVSLTMPAQVTTNNGFTRGYFFTAVNAFTITGLRVPTDASSANSNLAVLTLTNGTPPAYPAFTNSFNVLYVGQNIPGTAIVSVTIPIPAGAIVGVLGDRAGICSYATGPYTTNFLGFNVTLERLGMQYNLSGTLPQDLWTEVGGYISRVELYADGLCSSSLTPVTVSVVPNPTVQITTPSTLFCAGAPGPLLTANGANTYTWSTLSTNNSISVAPTSNTSYTVTGTNIEGCASSAVYEVTVSALPSISITATPSLICVGQSGSLLMSGGTSYTWTSGFSANPLPVSPVVTTTYGASGTGANGCVGSAVLSLSVSPLPTVNISLTPSVVCSGQSATITSSAANSYSWSTGQTSQNIVVTPPAVSQYVVTVKNAAGCSKTSAPLVLITEACVGINETSLTDETINIFPNPTNGSLTIQSVDPIQKLVFRDISGRTVLERSFDLDTDIKLSMENLSTGVYMVEIHSTSNTKIVKIAKD